MKTHHKRLLAVAFLIAIAGWLAWTLLTAESDIGPQGRLGAPRLHLASRV